MMLGVCSLILFLGLNVDFLCLETNLVKDKLKFNRDFSDEFNGGKIDELKWDNFNPDWLGRIPGLFSADNVYLENDELCLTHKFTAAERDIDPKKYGGITTAAVKSKKKILYGYFEIKAKVSSSATSSSFWLYDKTPHVWTEIDVFEATGKDGSKNRKIFMNAHAFKTPDVKQLISIPREKELLNPLYYRFHTFGLLWMPDKITWFFNGQIISMAENVHWHYPLHINFDVETMPDWFGLPALGDKISPFCIDYIRVWTITE